MKKRFTFVDDDDHEELLCVCVSDDDDRVDCEWST